MPTHSYRAGRFWNPYRYGGPSRPRRPAMFSPAAKGAALLKKVNEKLGKQLRPIKDTEINMNHGTPSILKSRQPKRKYIKSKKLETKINTPNTSAEHAGKHADLREDSNRRILRYLGVTKSENHLSNTILSQQRILFSPKGR